MALGNTRRNGVHGLFVTCRNCVHYAKVKVNIDAWPDDLPGTLLRPADAVE
jgi:hypothetical protein